MGKRAEKSVVSTSLPWLVAAGLAGGVLVGRWSGSLDATAGARPAPAKLHNATPGLAKTNRGAAARLFTHEHEFPAKWVKSAELAAVKGVTLGGLSEAQRATAMQALNERACGCGCGMESLALCARDDKACPTSPKLAAVAFELARKGKGRAELLEYLDGQGTRPSAGGPLRGPSAQPGARLVAAPAGAPRKGPAAAKVTIVAFSDFECPFCARVNPTLAQVVTTYPNDVAIVFVNQPLAMHENAEPAARAFLAAHRQGKAWAMHDELFENQGALGPADLERHARAAGLDLDLWKRDFADPAIAHQVARDRALAASVGVRGTPAFFVNGRPLLGARPWSGFKELIDEEIRKADALLAKGTKPEAISERLMADNVALVAAARR